MSIRSVRLCWLITYFRSGCHLASWRLVSSFWSESELDKAVQSAFIAVEFLFYFSYMFTIFNTFNCNISETCFVNHWYKLLFIIKIITKKVVFCFLWFDQILCWKIWHNKVIFNHWNFKKEWKLIKKNTLIL